QLLRGRHERDTNPAGLSDLACPCASGVDDNWRPDRTLVGLDTRDLVTLDEDSRGRRMSEKRDALRLGATREASGNLRRVEVHVVADTHDCDNAVGFNERVQAVRLLRRNALDVEA